MANSQQKIAQYHNQSILIFDKEKFQRLSFFLVPLSTSNEFEGKIIMALKTRQFFLITCFVSFLSVESFLLPNTTQPDSYLLILTTNVPGANRRFTGLLALTITVLENTNEILLHSRQHTINSYNLYEKNGLELEKISINRENDDVIKITSEQELKAGTQYDLMIGYHGNLLLASDGFFRSDYVVNDNGNDVYT